MTKKKNVRRKVVKHKSKDSLKESEESLRAVLRSEILGLFPTYTGPTYLDIKGSAGRSDQSQRSMPIETKSDVTDNAVSFLHEEGWILYFDPVARWIWLNDSDYELTAKEVEYLQLFIDFKIFGEKDRAIFQSLNFKERFTGKFQNFFLDSKIHPRIRETIFGKNSSGSTKGFYWLRFKPR